MASNFPNEFDTFINPSASTKMTGDGNLALAHSNQHNKLNDAVSALQQVIGVSGSTDVNSLQYKLQNVTTTPGPVGPTGQAGPTGPTGPAGSVSTSSNAIGSFAVVSSMIPFNQSAPISSLYIHTTMGDPAVAATTYLSGSWVSRGPITTGQTLIQRIA